MSSLAELSKVIEIIGSVKEELIKKHDYNKTDLKDFYNVCCAINHLTDRLAILIVDLMNQDEK